MQKQHGPSDLDLFLRISQSDEHAFSLCVYRFTPSLLPYLKSFVKSDLWADDLMQDVWVKLWNHRQHLRVVENPAAYLTKIASNLSLDFIRKQAVHSKIEYLLATQADATGKNSAEDKMHEEEIKNLIVRGISGLTRQQQKIYRLKYEEHKGYREIAAELGIGVTTVRKHLVDARSKMRTFFLKNSYYIILIACILEDMYDLF